MGYYDELGASFQSPLLQGLLAESMAQGDSDPPVSGLKTSMLRGRKLSKPLPTVDKKKSKSRGAHEEGADDEMMPNGEMTWGEFRRRRDEFEAKKEGSKVIDGQKALYNPATDSWQINPPEEFSDFTDRPLDLENLNQGELLGSSPLGQIFKEGNIVNTKGIIIIPISTPAILVFAKFLKLFSIICSLNLLIYK